MTSHVAYANWKEARVLITGGGGFIGSHLVRRLVSLGAHVTISTRSEPWRLVDISHTFEQIDLPLADREKIKNICRAFKPDIVVHLAGTLPRASQTPDQEANDVNGVSLLFEEANARHFITVGSALEYGRIPSPISEETEAAPFDAYGTSKLRATMWLEKNTTSHHTTVLRPCAVYGEAQKFALFVPVCIRACLTKKMLPLSPGEQQFDLLYIDDFVDGVLRTINRTGSPFEIINLSSGKAERLRDIALHIASQLRAEHYVQIGARPYGPYEPFIRVLSIEKAKHLLSWEPQTSLSDGLKKTIAWYQSNPDTFARLVV